VLLSECDASGRMSLLAALYAFQDVATQHSAQMGVDGVTLLRESRAHWVLTRTLVRLFERPALLGEVTVTTWPSQPVGVRCDRNYLLTRDGRRLLDGRAEWVIMDADTRHVRRLSSTCYPAQMAYRTDKPCEQPYRRLEDCLTDRDRVDTRTIRSTDIDMVGHTNNVVYARMFLDTFPAAFFEAREIASFEIHFLQESREGEAVGIYRRQEGADGCLFAARRADGVTTTLAALQFHPRREG
ncbi:MAG: acyl-ACP thioesterase domain-containing protein, partial [Eubacteriales bacterium]